MDSDSVLSLFDIDSEELACFSKVRHMVVSPSRRRLAMCSQLGVTHCSVMFHYFRNSEKNRFSGFC
jgi:hypothetical protein